MGKEERQPSPFEDYWELLGLSGMSERDFLYQCLPDESENGIDSMQENIRTQCTRRSAPVLQIAQQQMQKIRESKEDER